MREEMTKIDETVEFFDQVLPYAPEVCLMLGTGLGGVARELDLAWSASYGEIPNFPLSTAPEHAGRLLVGRVGSTRVALFQGRFHYYEGYSARQLAFPVRVMSRIGAGTFIGCNAAGGLELSFSSGDIMVIRDHINLIPDNPLRGPNLDPLGERFPDMSRAYSPRLAEAFLSVAGAMGVQLREGVFVAVPGPSLETPAETRFLRNSGAHAVAMSLVPEVIAAVHCGMDVLGLSVIANVNDPDNFRPILIEDVVEQASRAQDRLARLLVAFLKERERWKQDR